MWRTTAESSGPSGPRRDGTLEGDVTHARADRQNVWLSGRAVAYPNGGDLADRVDVDEVRGPCEAKRHGGHEALPARQNAPVLRGNLGEDGHRSSSVEGA